MSAEIDAPEADREISRTAPATEPEIEQHGRELDGIDPEALATMTAIQGNLAAAEAAVDEQAEKEARDWAAIEQAGIDEPVSHVEPQAAAKAEADQDADLEI
jgi:hypothetical protein